MNIEVSSEFVLSKDQLERVKGQIKHYYDEARRCTDPDSEYSRGSDDVREHLDDLDADEMDAIYLAHRPISVTLTFNLDPLTGALSPVEIKKNGR